jgi:hypothetical protein
MSVTHPSADFTAARPTDFAGKHPQLAPFLVALAIFVVSAAVILVCTGLPT